MQPEISHRCPACGVSIREFGERALFCPECGKPLAAAPETVPAEAKAGPVAADNSQAESAPAPTMHQESHPELVAERAGAEKLVTNADGRHGARERTRETLHRASTAARSAIEDNVKRVEKIQHVSSVMLEEAHYDPSLRFVLVAL